MSLILKNQFYNLIFLVSLPIYICSCESFKNWSAPSRVGANLTPEERQNTHIRETVANASSLDLTGVSRSINSMMRGPASAHCQEASGGDDRPSPSTDEHERDSDSPFAPLSAKEETKTPIELWATHYNTPVYNVEQSSVPLKKKNETNIDYRGQTVALSKRRWCMAAMEGSVSIRMQDGATKTYNYAGVGSMQVDCTPYFAGKHRATGRVKFMEVRSAWGLGVKNYSLIPYRTIAVDPDVIPYGSVVFIPEAKGREITLADGTTFTHDGYFFAGDTGGAIKRNHIDVFTGNNPPTNFPFIRSTPSGKFNAQIVHDSELRAKLEGFHRRTY